MIFDRPAWRSYVRQHPELELRLSSLRPCGDTYGFVVPANNDALKKKLNVLLLELRAERRVLEIADQWLTPSNSSAQ